MDIFEHQAWTAGAGIQPGVIAYCYQIFEQAFQIAGDIHLIHRRSNFAILDQMPAQTQRKLARGIVCIAAELGGDINTLGNP